MTFDIIVKKKGLPI